MDMVNDGKDIHLDTPQAVKEALASGKDLYNPQTGEFWWEYNYTGSIANTYVHLDDPNLLAVIDNPDFDLYEDIVGGLNYTGYITDSIETIIEDGEENAPLIDPRDEVFAQIASEDGWVIASPENVRNAVQSHMAEHGADAPGKEKGMDKTAEIAAWKENHVPIDRNGDDALVMHKMADGSREFIVDTRETSGIDLKGCGTVVTVDGHDYDVMKGATYEDSRKVDDLLDSHGDRPISDYRKRPQGMSLKQAVRESREASAKLAENNSGTDAPDGKDER